MVGILVLVNVDIATLRDRMSQANQPIRQLHPAPTPVILCPRGTTSVDHLRRQGPDKGKTMRYFLMIGALASLAACGGGGRGATGDISQACLAANRSAASPALCSCVQQVANQSLSGSDQARAATFFDNPQLAQDTRQSDRPGDERFWTRYRAFSDLASEICQPAGV